MPDSEDEWTVERHLAGQPDSSVELYDAFIRTMEGFGPFTYRVTKTMITLKGTQRGFAGARPDRAGLRGYFDLQREVRDRRITSASPFSRLLTVHHFRIATPADLGGQFVEWLREAYAVGNGVHVQ